MWGARGGLQTGSPDAGIEEVRAMDVDYEAPVADIVEGDSANFQLKA